jgi:hypothetical protein
MLLDTNVLLNSCAQLCGEIRSAASAKYSMLISWFVYMTPYVGELATWESINISDVVNRSKVTLK